VSGITFIRYAQSRKFAKPNNATNFGSKWPKQVIYFSQCNLLFWYWRHFGACGIRKHTLCTRITLRFFMNFICNLITIILIKGCFDNWSRRHVSNVCNNGPMSLYWPEEKLRANADFVGHYYRPRTYYCIFSLSSINDFWLPLWYP
jgi:hypothetical protein